MKINRTSCILLIILILGAILRLYGLAAHGIWYDEARSVVMSQNDLNMHSYLSIFSYKPLYFLFLKLWSKIFGIGAFWLRFPSVIFAILSLMVVYLVGKEIADKKLGLIASFLLAISCFHIYHSQQVRQYTMLVLLVLLSYLYFIRIIKQDNSLNYVINTLFNILIIFVHPYGLTIIIAQNISLLLMFRKEILRKRWFYCQIIIMFFILIWFFTSNKTRMFYNTWWIHSPNLNSILETFQTFSYGGPRYGLDDYRIIFRFPVFIMALFILYNALFIIGLIDRYADKRLKFLLIFWLFIPIAIASVVSFFVPAYLIKHLIIVLPAYYLIVAFGIYRLKKNSIIFLSLFLLFLLAIYPMKKIYLEDYNIDWKQTAEFLRKNIGRNDIILISTTAEITPFLYHFTFPNASSLKDIDTYGKLYNREIRSIFNQGNYLIVGLAQNQSRGIDFVRNDVEKKIKYIKDILGNSKSDNIWLAISRWTGVPEEEFIIGYLENIFNKDIRVKFRGVTVYKYHKS